MTTFSEKSLVNSSKFFKESARIPFTLNDHFTPDGGLKFSFGKTNQFHVKITKRKNVAHCGSYGILLPQFFPKNFVNFTRDCSIKNETGKMILANELQMVS